MLSAFTGAAYWKRRLGKWATPAEVAESGYTLLLPVPGDIPVFLEMALRVCAAQDSKNRARTIVLPDRPTGAVRRIVADAFASWPGPLGIELLPPPERWVLPHLRNGSRNHGLQLIAGVRASQTPHIVLHDADLFLLHDHFLESQYVECRGRNLDCLGVSPVWDPWFAEHGLRLAATWEMTASAAWLRKFAPWQHMGHDAELFGETHTFDTTLWAQTQTLGERVDVHERSDFVHFNYVITTYRHFQRHGPGYEDQSFRLLLIALLVELFGSSESATLVPPLASLARGLGNPDSLVLYPEPTAESSGRYADFRCRLTRALGAPYLHLDAAGADKGLDRFDEYYGYTAGNDRG